MEVGRSLSLPVFVSLLASSLLSCSTTAPLASIDKLSKSRGPITGASVSLNLTAVDSGYTGSGCSLGLVHSEESKDYELPFNKNGSLAFVSLPPGTYGMTTLMCGSKIWDLEGDAPFRIYQGSISFLSGLTFMVEGERLRSIHDKNLQDREQLLRLFTRLPKGAKAQVVSGYTGMILPLELVKRRGELRKWSVSPAPGKNKVAAWPDFDDCYTAEKKGNPLLLGELEAKAAFRSGKLTNLNFTPEWNTLSNTFRGCARRVLESFRPVGNGSVVYSLYL